MQLRGVSQGFRALILGAAAGGGLPQWNYGCRDDLLARQGEIAPQTQSSLAVTGGGRRWAILDVSPDVREQFTRTPALHPTGQRELPLSSVLVTLADRIDGADLVFFDGTLWQDDDMRLTGVGVKTGKRMGHMSMSGSDGSMAAFAPLDIDRKVYVHMNKTNPVFRPDGPERAAAEAAGWTIGQDGMEIEL
ncbi:MAG: MBL fold metallo-hydrolase [Pseudomonadota bacterium]